MNYKKTFLFLLTIVLITFCYRNVNAQNQQNGDFNKAKLLTLEGKYSQAIDILLSLDKKDLEDMDILYYLALNYQSLSNYQNASSVLEKALSLKPENVKLMTMLGDNYYSAGRITKADSILSVAYSIDSTDLNILLSLGRVFKKEQSWHRAKKTYRTLAKRDTSNSFYFEQLAYCNIALKDTNSAVVNFQIAHKLNPYNQNTILELSNLYFSQQKLISALRIINDGLKVYPYSPAMWTKRGDINLKMKNYSEAVSEYQKSINLGDSSEINFRNLGISYYWIEKYDSSISSLTRAIKIMKKDPTAYFYLGTSYKGLKQYDKAIENLLRAARLQRNDFLAETLIQIGATFYEQKNYSEALKFYQDALREKPDKNEIVFYLVAVYDHYYRDKSVAINYYKKFLSAAKAQIDTNLLKYAKSRIDVLIEENHFSKHETSN